MKKLEGKWPTIAKSKCGSRCLDNIFQIVAVQQKEQITKELCDAEADLKYDFYGRFALQNCKVDQFKLKKDHWENALLNRDKKRKMFSEIINDTSEQPLTKKKKLSHTAEEKGK